MRKTSDFRRLKIVFAKAINDATTCNNLFYLLTHSQPFTDSYGYHRFRILDGSRVRGLKSLNERFCLRLEEDDFGRVSYRLTLDLAWVVGGRNVLAMEDYLKENFGK